MRENWGHERYLVQKMLMAVLEPRRARMGMQVKDGDVSCLVGEEEELVLRREAIRPRE